MSYYLTTGNNLRMYFHYPEGMQESGTLHVYAYNNARMEGFPIIDYETDLDLRKCHPSIYGSHYIELGTNYTGQSWWFAWVDTTQDDSQNNFLGWSGNNYKPTGFSNYSITTNSASLINPAAKYGLTSDLSDPAGMPYGQSGLSGINLTTGLNKVFFSLEENIRGFPQFAWPNIDKRNTDQYTIKCTRISSGTPILFKFWLKRNFFCAQDLLLHPTRKYYTNGLVSGRGIPHAQSAGNIFVFKIGVESNLIRKLSDTTSLAQDETYPIQTYNWNTQIYSTSSSLDDLSPVYNPIIPIGYPTGWNNLGE